MESLIFSVNAVLPIVLIVALGYAIKRLGIIGETVAAGLNKLAVISTALPTPQVQLFNSFLPNHILPKKV